MNAIVNYLKLDVKSSAIALTKKHKIVSITYNTYSLAYFFSK